ncbi:MAG: 16S rRNA (cytidine(1402)-2'-O)-methyltransferase [Acidimicrobiales bacterium]
MDDPDILVEEGPGPAGILVLVGTPIGNLGDLSPRAVHTLSTADVIYCEDTRHSRKLLTHAGISGVRLRSLHRHNEDDRIDEVVASVAAGRTVAMVSDAGMPGISDPGGKVVAAVASAGLGISVIPGPSAVLSALVTSGLPTDRFCFEGFLPRSGRERRHRLASVAGESRTTVLFEAPGRLAATLGELAQACGHDRPVAVARELTKLHEQIWRGSAGDVSSWVAAEAVRGEVVIVVAGIPEADVAEVEDGPLVEALGVRLASGERTRGAVDAVAGEFGVPRRRVYDLALAPRNDVPVPGVAQSGAQEQ